MSADKLYKIYQQATEAFDIAAEAEAEARLKNIKARRAADAAEKNYTAKSDEYHRASERQRAAYNDWAKAHAEEGGAS